MCAEKCNERHIIGPTSPNARRRDVLVRSETKLVNRMDEKAKLQPQITVKIHYNL
jgi:hypothetical protein